MDGNARGRVSQFRMGDDPIRMDYIHLGPGLGECHARREPPNNLRHSARAAIVERWIFRLPDGNVNFGRAPKLKGRWDHADDCEMPPVQRQSLTYGTRRRTKSIPPESLVH